jgi:hypothetical protein
MVTERGIRILLATLSLGALDKCLPDVELLLGDDTHVLRGPERFRGRLEQPEGG